MDLNKSDVVIGLTVVVGELAFVVASVVMITSSR